MQVIKQLTCFPDMNFFQKEIVFLPNQLLLKLPSIHQYRKDLVHLIIVPELYLLRWTEMLTLVADK